METQQNGSGKILSYITVYWVRVHTIISNNTILMLCRALKAFINVRKPREGSRKITRPRKPQSMQTPLLPKGDTSHHDATHESSSQSSSAENGEPQTPSPHYTEPLANRFSHIVDDETMKAEPSATGMDPHFARLLSSLTMSASVLSHEIDEKKANVVTPTTITNPPEYRKRNTPIPAFKSSEISPTSTSQVDWSASAPNVTSPRISVPTPSLSLSTPQSIFPSQSGQTHHIASPHSIDDVEGKDMNSVTPQETSSVTPSSTSTLISPRSLAPLQTPNTTDLLPSLQRPAENTTSTKVLRQLALLEAVADESARMSPFLNHAAPSNAEATYHNARNTLPDSVPPPPMMSYHSHDLRMGYTVQPPPTHSVSHMFSSTPLPQDQFQTRSKTSHTYHRGPLGGPSGSLSMNQSQLLSLMSGPRAAPQTPHLYSQPSQFQGVYLPPSLTSVPGMHHPPAQNAMYPINSSPFPPRIHPTPYAGSSMTPGIHGPSKNSYPVSGSLLSILNSGRSGPYNHTTSPQLFHSHRPT